MTRVQRPRYVAIFLPLDPNSSPQWWPVPDDADPETYVPVEAVDPGENGVMQVCSLTPRSHYYPLPEVIE